MEARRNTKPVKTGWIRLFAVFAAILLLFSFGFFGVSLLVRDADFIEEQYSALGTDEEMGMTVPDLSRATLALFDYMRGARDSIKVSVRMNGVVVDDLFYHSKEIVHMEEVRALWRTLTLWAIVGVAAALGLFAGILFFGPHNTRLRNTGLGLMIGTLIFLGVMAAAALWALGDFNSFWTVFHFIIFPSSLITYLSGGMTVEVYNSLNWVFEPDFAMIRMLDELFLPLVLRASLYFAVEIAALLLISVVLYLRGRRLEQVGSDLIEERPVEIEARYVPVEDAPDLVLQHKLKNASLEQKKKLMEELRKTPEELEREAEERAFADAEAAKAAHEEAKLPIEELEALQEEPEPQPEEAAPAPEPEPADAEQIREPERVSPRGKLDAADDDAVWQRPDEAADDPNGEPENDLF